MRAKAILTVAALALIALVLPVAAQASITVTSQSDSGSGSLRAAIEAAPSGETIVVPAGTYTLVSPLFIGKNLTISGHAAADTIIRSNVEEPLLEVEGTTATVSGVTFREARISTAKLAAVDVLGADLTLREVAVIGNTAAHSGGPGEAGAKEIDGAGILAVAGALTLVDSVVANNTIEINGGAGAAGGSGGGAGLFAIASKLKVEGSTFSGNRVEARGGQGPSNPAQDGGSADAAGLATVASPDSTIADSTFTGNTNDASAGPGGEAGQAAAGGVFLVATQGTLKASNLTITGNANHATGALGSESLALGGGLIGVAGEKGSIELLGATVVGNSVEGAKDEGGNMLIEGSARVGDTIVAGGQGPPATSNCFQSSSPGSQPTSLGFNIDSTDQCGFHAAGDQVNTDPALGPLGANGGLVQTMAPLPGSPAIDKGARFGLGTDARGIVRPVDFPSIPNAAGGDGSDVGAVEIAPVASLKLGKVAKNKKKGTATVTVTPAAPAAGSLVLKGKGLKTQTVPIGAKDSVKLKLAAKGGSAKKLKKQGKLKVKYEIAYSPVSATPVAKKGSTKLVRIHKRKRNHR